MPVRDRDFLEQERRRLSRYLHQHRGLNFLKLLLPLSTDKEVNLIGINNHVYRGKIPKMPLNELSPSVDSVDEEFLYKEIKDIEFPYIPPPEPLGPVRRIGGTYTKVQRLLFAPVKIRVDDRGSATSLLGANGKTYRGSPVTYELDSKIRSRRTRKPLIPTTVSLLSSKFHGTVKSQGLQIPLSEINRIIDVMRGFNSKEFKTHFEESSSENESEDELVTGADEFDINETETGSDIVETEEPYQADEYNTEKSEKEVETVEELELKEKLEPEDELEYSDD